MGSDGGLYHGVRTWKAPQGKQALSPPVVSMRRGWEREAMGRDDIGTDIDDGEKRGEARAEARRGRRHGTKHESDEMTGAKRRGIRRQTSSKQGMRSESPDE